MRYEPRDRAPLMDFGFWDETLPVWREQGLPDWVNRTNSDEFFGMDGLEHWWASTLAVTEATENSSQGGINTHLFPQFEWQVIEDRGDHEVVQQHDGVRVLRKKFMGSIPMHEGHLLVDRASWEKHYKPLLDPTSPDRLPPHYDELAKKWADPQREHLVILPGGSLYGWIRNWMGVEEVSYLVYDDPALFEEMVETIADCIVGTLERLLVGGVQFDALSMWEDMCYNTGPLLSPQHFKQYLVPHYRRITDLVRKHGTDVSFVDCDGCIDELIPLWIEGGINCMFPIEVGTWGTDPRKFREQYGRDLLLMGGFDKHILAESPHAISAEVRRLAPLVEDGGYIGFCDHRVPPDVPLSNYMHYLREVRNVWCHNVDLLPLQEPAMV